MPRSLRVIWTEYQKGMTSGVGWPILVAKIFCWGRFFGSRKLKYMDMVVRETLRLCSPVQVGVLSILLPEVFFFFKIMSSLAQVAQRGLTQPVQCGKYTLLPGGHSGRGASKNWHFEAIFCWLQGGGWKLLEHRANIFASFFLGLLSQDGKFLLREYGESIDQEIWLTLCVSQLLGHLQNHLELLVISLGNPGVLKPPSFFLKKQHPWQAGSQGTPGLLAPQKLVDLRKRCAFFFQSPELSKPNVPLLLEQNVYSPIKNHLG